jgi:hypothetical protein
MSEEHRIVLRGAYEQAFLDAGDGVRDPDYSQFTAACQADYDRGWEAGNRTRDLAPEQLDQLLDQNTGKFDYSRLPAILAGTYRRGVPG